MSASITRSLVSSVLAVVALSAVSAASAAALPAGEAAFETPSVVTASSVNRAELRNQAAQQRAEQTATGFNAEAGQPLFAAQPSTEPVARTEVRNAAIQATQQKAKARFVDEAGSTIG